MRGLRDILAECELPMQSLHERIPFCHLLFQSVLAQNSIEYKIMADQHKGRRSEDVAANGGNLTTSIFDDEVTNPRRARRYFFLINRIIWIILQIS